VNQSELEPDGAAPDGDGADCGGCWQATAVNITATAPVAQTRLTFARMVAPILVRFPDKIHAGDPMTTKALVATGFLFAFAAGFVTRGSVSVVPTLQAQTSPHVWELRTYTAAPGKMDALHARFRDNTNRIFAKHGVKNLTYWTPTDGPNAANTLIYVIPHASREAATKFWADFQGDPEWVKVKAASEANGPLTTNVASVFMKATDYSAQK
jgi:NIPSNAP protein